MSTTPRSRPLLAAVLLLAAVAGACSDSWSRKQKTSVSALWLGPTSESLTTSTVARLQDAGVEELYVAAARLEPVDDGEPLTPLELPTDLPSLPLVLAIQGERWNLDSEERAESLGRRVAQAARQLRLDVENRGQLVVGVHFDVGGVRDFGTYARFLRAVGAGLDDDVLLSATLERRWLARDGVERVADAVDYLVPLLYGQRVDETEDADAWDFAELERNMQAMEDLGAPYQLGVVVLGTATHLGAKGGVKARTTRLSLQELLWNRSFDLEHGFTLEGINRRVYTVKALRTVALGKWRVAKGDEVRVVRAATSDLEELLRLVDVWDVPNHLGQVYYRLPHEDEKLSLHRESLLNALAPETAQPDLRFEVAVQRRTGRGWLVRFGIENQNREFTELALLDNNYLQVTVLGDGHFSSNDVATGEFYRFDVLRRTGGGELERTFRDPNVLRLYVPLLEGQQQVMSDDVQVVVRGEPAFELEARFLLTDGRTLEIGPQRWRGGELVPVEP